MSPQRRTALVSVAAAGVLLVLKLTVGLATNSLGLVSEAIHSGTDLVAALLTFFAVGVAGRPADRTHQYGHGKAENLAALAEATILAAVALLIAERALERLLGHGGEVNATWYAIAVVVIVIAIDTTRTVVSWRASHRYRSAAFAANAVALRERPRRSFAVLAGLLVARAGFADGDSIAALFVAVLVITAAARLMRGNIDVLMDRAPADAESAARRAIRAMQPTVELRRLRMRQAAGRQFADVVIGVSPSAGVAQGHAAADAVEAAVGRALPDADVVVHGERIADASVSERASCGGDRRPERPRGTQHRSRRRRRTPSCRCTRSCRETFLSRRLTRSQKSWRRRSAPLYRRSPASRDAPRAADRESRRP
jgi:cation diffusion facilitator family transporter